MNLLELFSGTGSVGRIARDLGFDVISLDLKGADINKPPNEGSPFCGIEQSILWNGAVHFGKWSSPFWEME